MHNESILKLMASRKSAGEVLAGIAGKGVKQEESRLAGSELLVSASQYGLNVRDYLDAAITPEGDYSGYELAKAELNLPTRDDYKRGVTIEAASDTFNTFPGSRALFPEVIDDVLQWANRQLNFEHVEPMLAGSRTTAGNELLFTIIDDDSAARKTSDVPELGRIPVRTIRSTQNAVKFYKVGSGIRTSYEFSRRSRLDILTPFLSRIARELEQDKVRHATNIIVNGDGDANGAATVKAQSAIAAAANLAAPTSGEIDYLSFLKWLNDRAAAGTPIDTILMNYDGFFQWNRLFAVSKVGGATDAQDLARAGVDMSQFGNLGLNFSVKPVISSTVPAKQIVGITKGETLEELKEANSNIEESQRNIRNQSAEVYKTENVGYRLVYADAREVYNYGA